MKKYKIELHGSEDDAECVCELSPLVFLKIKYIAELLSNDPNSSKYSPFLEITEID